MACSCIPFWSTAATVFPLVSNNKLVSKRITRAEYLNGAINPCGPKGGINTSKPRHDRPLAESSLDGTGSNYLQLNRTSRLLDYLLWRRRTPGQLSLPSPPLPTFFWHFLLLLFLFVSTALFCPTHRLIKRILIRGFESKKLFSIISLFLSNPSKMFSHKTTLLCFQDVTEPYNGKLKKNQSHWCRQDPPSNLLLTSDTDLMMISVNTTCPKFVRQDATCAATISWDLPQHCHDNKYIFLRHFGTSGRVTQQRGHKETKQRKEHTVCDMTDTALLKTIFF